jgi:serine/threonine-protein kinase
MAPSAALADKLEAWMPEQIAVVKLRGFVNAHGGKVVESMPGMIRLRLPLDGLPEDPRRTPTVMSWLRLGPTKEPEPTPHALVELYMEKKTVGNRNLLFISVLMFRDGTDIALPRTPEWGHFKRKICRDLRAHLISN